MRVKLLQGYNGFPVGRVLNVAEGVARLLIQRMIAESVDDPDSDGKAEGGEQGEKKAFSGPPKAKRKRN